MRIIAGRFKGRILHSVPGRKIRPTSDRLRETLFNILQADTAGAVVWDAFAGTGALGLEALSRGARFVVFTEQSRQAFELLKKNIGLLGVAAESELVHTDAIHWARQSSRQFDLIFLDPPYDFQQYGDLARAVGAAGVCHEGTKVVLEHCKKSATVAELVKLVHPYRRVRQGDSVLSFFRGEEFHHLPGSGKGNE
jgi:16S rRNA (guanine(966)-N(2))-methyltransferase RsmD